MVGNFLRFASSGGDVKSFDQMNIFSGRELLITVTLFLNCGRELTVSGMEFVVHKFKAKYWKFIN